MPTEITKVGPKYQVTIPKEVREQLGLKVGDLVHARVGKGRTIIMQRKRLVDFDTELEQDLAAAAADQKAGRVLGPFDTAEQTVAALKRSSHKLNRTTKARPRAKSAGAS
jgi:AbrB family looped-hinge helix DNA binding protein